jgi:hypothetical protein
MRWVWGNRRKRITPIGGKMRTIRTKLAIIALTALSGCAWMQEPHEVTVMKWCDGGRNAVIMAYNSRSSNQRAMIKQTWSEDAYTYIAGDKPSPPESKFGWDADPVGEQWAATQWVYNLPLERLITTDPRDLETQYVSYCNRVNNWKP